MMSSGYHQQNQAAPISGTIQYQVGDQVLEIPSNINYQFDNIIAAGGVSSASRLTMSIAINYT
jgi:hypothetical protein